MNGQTHGWPAALRSFMSMRSTQVGSKTVLPSRSESVPFQPRDLLEHIQGLEGFPPIQVVLHELPDSYNDGRTLVTHADSPRPNFLANPWVDREFFQQ